MFTTNIQAFKQLGKRLSDPQWVDATFGEAIERQYRENSWFTPEFCRYALSAIARMLAPEALDTYHARYQDIAPTTPPRKCFAVISAGNIPLAAFHDFFCILVSGNDYQGKLSSQDKHLLPVLAQELIRIEPAFEERISFVEKVADFDAIIATGSNNSARYFDYYFSKYPHILRKNRNSVAVLNETESDQELRALADDIYLYFGLGCRSVSKLFMPRNYDFVPFLQILTQESQPIALHHQFNNNLEYQKAVHLMNQIPYMDAGTFLLVENQNYASPIGMINYEFYDDIEVVNDRLEADSELLQCIVSRDPRITRAEPFGSAQSPTLSDYPDGIDTLRWMLAIGC
ncbi:MAG: hypothetical protein J6T87_11420 [Bacteroidales bacterium]|nr:hypothetical protein [Bacteroidales bacterium]